MSKVRETRVTVKVRAPGSTTVTVQVKSEPKARRTPLTLLKEQERDEVGGFSEPSKMPWLSWSTPAERCQVGSRLREVEGSTCSGCYALKGNYAWPGVKAALERRFRALSDLPVWTESMAKFIRERAGRFSPAASDPWPAFRWHDAGDVQSVEHLAAICAVAERTQGVLLADGSRRDVKHWLPTREYAYVTEFLRHGGVIPRNLCVRLSAHLKDGPAPARYGLPVSTVHTRRGAYEGAWMCPAYRQGGRCGDCRACWDTGVSHVSYPAH